MGIHLNLCHHEISVVNGHNMQGKLVLKDFNIEDAAGGAGKEIIKIFTIAVTNQTLEICFYWAGKGTSAIPSRGVYGPLISAISVTSSKLCSHYKISNFDQVEWMG